MSVFQQLEGEVAVLRKDGVYQQVDLYTRRDGELFAEVSRGKFVRLYGSGATSQPKVVLDHLELDATDLTTDQFGKLCIGPGPKRKALGTPSWLALEDQTS